MEAIEELLTKLGINDPANRQAVGAEMALYALNLALSEVAAQYPLDEADKAAIKRIESSGTLDEASFQELFPDKPRQDIFISAVGRSAQLAVEAVQEADGS